MRGFTLLEVMVALAIMAGAILTLISAFNYQLNQVTRNREETVAALMGRAKLEELELQKDPKPAEGSFAPANPDLHWKLETEPTYVPIVKRLTMTVTWNEGKRRLALVHYLPTLQ
jgi:general secretion pathway protein I